MSDNTDSRITNKGVVFDPRTDTCETAYNKWMSACEMAGKSLSSDQRFDLWCAWKTAWRSAGECRDAESEVKMIGEENGALTQQWSALEYHWQWMTPDKPGLWAFGGRMPGDQKGTWCAIEVESLPNSDPGWWCFLMDLPTIQPPKKTTVWRMWAIPSRIEHQWLPEGKQPSRTDAIRTDKTEEREE